MFYILAMNIPHLTETKTFFGLLQCHKLHYFVTWPFGSLHMEMTDFPTLSYT